ncbi:MAG: dipicolinate synthase subunit DpsA [Eubacterium sp.]
MNTFAILSGDNRQIFTNDYLNNHNFHSYIKTNLDFNNDKIIVCCTPFTKNGKYINCDLYSSFPIDTFISLLKPGQIVFGGSIPEQVISQASNSGVNFIDVLKDKDVVWNNAMLTAEGLIAQIILNTDFSLNGSKALILGFGKCGTNIASRLSALNCNVTIHDHTPEHLSQAASFGYHVLDYSLLSEFIKDFDIIINTVPSEILSDYQMSLIRNSCVLFEIASKPYGFNTELVKKYNLSLITCPGLPGATAPKSAGELIAKSIISYLERTGINGS